MPQPYVTRAVVSVMEGLPRFPALSVLDLSCGEGEILAELASRGCQVQGTHFRDDDYIVGRRDRLANLEVTKGVNLSNPLPFPSASFDAVLLIEVLEHLDGHFQIVAEAGRLLRPGAFLIFTTPNIFRLHSRFQFFLTGKHKLIRRRFGWDLRSEDRYAYHINPVDFPLMHTLLHQAGLTIQDLHFTRMKWKSCLFFPLWALVWLSCRLTLDRHAKRSVPFRNGEQDLNRWLSHPALLYSEQLLVVARRTEDKSQLKLD